MTETITIEGSILPSAYLARGERQVVRADDPTAKALVLGGYAVVVDTNTVPTPDETEAPQAVEPPARNASRDDWAEFLAQHHGEFVTEGEDRASLIDQWDEYVKSLED